MGQKGGGHAFVRSNPRKNDVGMQNLMAKCKFDGGRTAAPPRSLSMETAFLADGLAAAPWAAGTTLPARSRAG